MDQPELRDWVEALLAWGQLAVALEAPPEEEGSVPATPQAQAQWAAARAVWCREQAALLTLTEHLLQAAATSLHRAA